MSFMLVDTDILIDAAAQNADAIGCLKHFEGKSTLAVSAVTELELLVGCRNKTELQKTDRLLERFQVIPLNEQISNGAIGLIRKYRLSHGLLLADALIASTALVMDCEFVSKNQRDYRFVDKLRLLDYPLK
jgi:predicted nucleic acid-binding protein